MFGKIIAIDNDLITVSNTTHVAESSVLNYHVIYNHVNENFTQISLILTRFLLRSNITTG